MENKSYIKLYRKLLNSPIFENEKALKIWIWCLLKASHKERLQLVGQQKVLLNKGEFIFGRKKASEELLMTESTVYKYIKLLEELEMITIKSNTKFSIIKIEKWDEYQFEKIQESNSNYNSYNNSNSSNKITGSNSVISEETTDDLISEITATITANDTTKEQQSNTNKNVKNVNIIFNYFINKYRQQNLVRLDEKIKFLREIKKDNKYLELSSDDEYELRNYILSDVRFSK